MVTLFRQTFDFVTDDVLVEYLVVGRLPLQVFVGCMWEAPHAWSRFIFQELVRLDR